MESKFKLLLKELDDLRKKDPLAKTLVFSSFGRSLAWLAARLKENGFEHATLTGKMSLSARAGAERRAANVACPTGCFRPLLLAAAHPLIPYDSAVLSLPPHLPPARSPCLAQLLWRLSRRRRPPPSSSSACAAAPSDLSLRCVLGLNG